MEFIRRRDPSGFFVVYLKKKVRGEVEKHSVLIEDYGDCIIVKTKSRRTALSIINKFKNDLCLE